MDAKAAMRSRKRANQGQKIDSPLVRYNGLGQPVCNVCNVTVKSESLWTAHTLSRQHKAAVDEFKAKAAANSREPPRVNLGTAVHGAQLEYSLDSLPDTPETKRPNLGLRDSSRAVSAAISVETATQDGEQISAPMGTLPKGFFDNQDADSRARGLEVVKVNIQEEYHEFQKSIEEDVQGVDVRLDEEEFEAAEDREELEQREQRNLLERIEAHKKRQQEKAAAATKLKATQSKVDEVVEEESSDESDDGDNLFVDWRAKRL